MSKFLLNFVRYEINTEQAGAEPGQAQLQLELGFTLIKLCIVPWTGAVLAI